MFSLVPPGIVFSVLIVVSLHSSEAGESVTTPSYITTEKGLILIDLVARFWLMYGASSKAMYILSPFLIVFVEAAESYINLILSSVNVGLITFSIGSSAAL